MGFVRNNDKISHYSWDNFSDKLFHLVDDLGTAWIKSSNQTGGNTVVYPAVNIDTKGDQTSVLMWIGIGAAVIVLVVVLIVVFKKNNQL